MAPSLTEQPVLIYPPIARAAHVSGSVEIRFTVAADGSFQDVRELSGPVMLSRTLVERLRGWRFALPLPLNISRDWTARVTYRLDADNDHLEDAVDQPPWFPCCGDSITVVAPDTTTTGVLEGEHGERVDLKPAAPVPAECPFKEDRTAPADISPSDFIDLDRRGNYRLRVYRSGLIEWSAPDDSEVSVKGEHQFSTPPPRAQGLFQLFAHPAVWSICGIAPPAELDEDGERVPGEYLTVRFGQRSKTINLWNADSRDGVSSPKLAWAVDTATNSHQWRHGDSVGESFRNMQGDLRAPKPGITALMRATDHYNPSTGQWTDAALKLQLARGVDVEAVDESGWAALMYAAGLHGGCCEDSAVKLLLDAHANPNHAGLHGETPLMAAAYEGTLSAALLKAGAEINARDADGVTSLMLLAQQQRVDELAEAIAQGADAAALDAQGRSALDYLREAACGRALVPLPAPSLAVVVIHPTPCTSGKAYLEGKALLEAAMNQRAASKQR